MLYPASVLDPLASGVTGKKTEAKADWLIGHPAWECSPTTKLYFFDRRSRFWNWIGLSPRKPDSHLPPNLQDVQPYNEKRLKSVATPQSPNHKIIYRTYIGPEVLSSEERSSVINCHQNCHISLRISTLL